MYRFALQILFKLSYQFTTLRTQMANFHSLLNLITVNVKHIPVTSNAIANALSRLQMIKFRQLAPTKSRREIQILPQAWINKKVIFKISNLKQFRRTLKKPTTKARQAMPHSV